MRANTALDHIIFSAGKLTQFSNSAYVNTDRFTFKASQRLSLFSGQHIQTSLPTPIADAFHHLLASHIHKPVSGASAQI
jgi:hypothetical protein